MYQNQERSFQIDDNYEHSKQKSDKSNEQRQQHLSEIKQKKILSNPNHDQTQTKNQQQQNRKNSSNIQQFQQIINKNLEKEMDQENKIQENANRLKLKKQYYDFFKNILPDAQKYIPQLPNNQEFKNHKIKYLKGNQFHQSLHSFDQSYIKVKNTQRQGSIVNYTVIIGMFELEIILLNIDKVADRQWNKIGSGQFGSVRIQSQNKRMFAVKRQMFRNDYHLKQFNMMANKYEINQAITELAIYKICSLLKIGPAAETQIGFDLICYRDCMEFQIQYCMKIGDQKQGIFVDERIFEKQIKLCLLILHFYGIIHKDIKPANILFSIKYNKYVLTDFGISHPVVEKIGYRSKTHRQGTRLYMSKQMRQIEKGKIGYLHLYGNDVWSLQCSLNKWVMNQNIEQGIKKFNQKIIKQYNTKYEYEYLKLKYYCIKPDINMKEVQNYWRYMDTNRTEELLSIIDKSIEFNKIKSVYSYLTKFQQFKKWNLESLKIQSQSIINTKIDPSIKTISQLQLKNILRVFGYSQQVKNMIIKLKLQQKFKDTLKIIDKAIDKNSKYNCKDWMFGNYENYIRNIKKQLYECEQNQDYKGMFDRYMIILSFGHIQEKIDVIQKLKIFNYQRNQVQKIEQLIKVNSIEKKKEKLKQFFQFMEIKDEERQKNITENKLDDQVAGIYNYLGKYKTALQYYYKSLKMKMSLHGKYHPFVANTYCDIADVYDNIGHYSTALKFFTKSLKMQISFYGQQHLNIASIYKEIGNNYNRTGKYKYAFQNYLKSLKIIISFYGQKHPSVASIYSDIGNNFYNMGLYQQALKNLTKSLNIMIQYKKYLSVAGIYSHIGNIYVSQTKYVKALQSYTKSLNIELSFYGQQHPDIGITYNNIAAVYAYQKKYITALIYYQKSLKISISSFGQQDLDVAPKYNNMAVASLQLNKIYQAHKYCYKSISIFFCYQLDSCVQTAFHYHLLSKIFLKKEKYAQSLKYAYFSLNTFLNFNNLNHPQSPNYLQLLGYIYYQKKKFITAYFLYRLSYQILMKYFDICHTLVLEAKKMISDIEMLIPSLIHNYQTNIQFINEINSKYIKLSKHKLMKLLLAKKLELRFQQQHKSTRSRFEYLKCLIEIYLCYKYLGYSSQRQNAGESIKVELSQFEQTQQKSMFRGFISKISYDQ